MGPTLRSIQDLKQEAENIGLQGKDIAEYVTRQQTLDREERSAWRDTKKRQIEFRMAEELQAERKKRADESHIKIQIAQDPDCSRSRLLRLRLRKNKPRLRLRKNKPRLRLRKNRPR